MVVTNPVPVVTRTPTEFGIGSILRYSQPIFNGSHLGGGFGDYTQKSTIDRARDVSELAGPGR